jgi:hypothetical protein
VDRIQIAQAALNAAGRGNYLEIGVRKGESFIPLRAARKWGVDPDPHLNWKRLAKSRLISLLYLKHQEIFKETSDEFFKKHDRLLRKHGIDVSLIDGLHSYEQALRDVLNCLDYLKPNGVILMHDCNPANEIMALPAAGYAEIAARNIPNWAGLWCGDVYKAVIHLRAMRDDLNVFVLDCDYGVGVVSRGHSAEKLSHSERDIQEMDYGFFEKNRKKLLGLRPPDYIYEFLQSRDH